MYKLMGYMLLFLLLHLSPAVQAQDDEYEEDEPTQVTVEPPRTTNQFFSDHNPAGPYQAKQLPRQTIDNLKESDDYWYANAEPVKKTEKEAPRQRNFLEHAWVRNLLWIIILGSFIGVVIWYLASSNISLFRRASAPITEEEPGPELNDDIHSINYEREIEKAVSAANYRLAIRLWYLRTLKELADRNLIEYRQQRTNSDYLASLGASRYYRDFFRLTRNFEYTWYGQFPLSAEGYEMMRTDFSNFKNNLS